MRRRSRKQGDASVPSHHIRHPRPYGYGIASEATSQVRRIALPGPCIVGATLAVALEGLARARLTLVPTGDPLWSPLEAIMLTQPPPTKLYP
jgi:hypothetical protein